MGPVGVRPMITLPQAAPHGGGADVECLHLFLQACQLLGKLHCLLVGKLFALPVKSPDCPDHTLVFAAEHPGEKGIVLAGQGSVQPLSVQLLNCLRREAFQNPIPDGDNGRAELPHF